MSGGLTLSGLLQHPDTGVVTVVSGLPRDGSEPEWSAVVVEAQESDLPATVVGGLAVLVQPAPTSTWQVDALLRRVRDRGFTGIALTGPPIDNGSRALAERLGILVLHVERPTRLARACWALVEARDALSLAAVRRLAQSVEYQAHDLGDLLRHVAASIGQGIALIDEEGVLQSAGQPIPADVLARIRFDHWLDVAECEEGLVASVPVESRTRQGLRIALFGRHAGAAHRRFRRLEAERFGYAR